MSTSSEFGLGDYSAIKTALSSVEASPQIREFLYYIHAKAFVVDVLRRGGALPMSDPTFHSSSIPDPNKCALLYILLRATEARFVVEVGSETGIRTIYLALAVTQNVVKYSAFRHIGYSQSMHGRVVAAEADSSLAAKANGLWTTADEEIKGIIQPKVGDFRETLSKNILAPIDFVLLDFYAIHATRDTLTTLVLDLMRPHLKTSAMVVIDNVVGFDSAAGFLSRYQELLAYLGDPTNGFRSTMNPYFGGMLVAVYMGQPASLDLSETATDAAQLPTSP